jgi:hypothetical protein
VNANAPRHGRCDAVHHLVPASVADWSVI